MTGSYLFNPESYHNGLMTDLGLPYPMLNNLPQNRGNNRVFVST